MGRGPEHTLLPELHSSSQKRYEKMHNLTSYQGNANSNYNEISPHTCQNGYYQRQIITSVGEVVGKKEPSLIHCCWECQLTQPPWKTVWRLLKKIKTRVTYNPANPLLSIYLKILKTFICKDIFIYLQTHILCLLRHYSWQRRHGNNPRPPIDDWIRKMWYMYTYTMEYNTAI